MAVIAYPFRVADNYGSLVAGAVVEIGSVTLTSQLTAYSVPAGVNLSTGAPLNGSTGPSVEYVDYGTGDYALLYDPETFGEAYFPLTVSKSGSTITGDNALQPVFATKDSSRIVVALPNASVPNDTTIQTDAAAALTANAVLTNLAAMIQNSSGEQFTAHALAQAPGGGSVTVGGYSSGQDPATLLASDFSTVNTTLTTIEGHAANADNQSATAVTDLGTISSTLTTIEGHASNADSQSATAISGLTTVLTDIGAIEAVTNLLNAMIQNSGGEQFTVHALANAPSGGGGGVTDSSVVTDVENALTAQGYTTARAALLDDLSTILTNVNTAITNISGIPTNLLSAVVDGSMTVKQVLDLDESIIAGKYSNTPAPEGGGTQTTTYYRADGTTVLATDTVTINSSGQSTARGVSFTNLP